jgi:hypothetical protein
MSNRVLSPVELRYAFKPLLWESLDPRLQLSDFFENSSRARVAQSCYSNDVRKAPSPRFAPLPKWRIQRIVRNTLLNENDPPYSPPPRPKPLRTCQEAAHRRWRYCSAGCFSLSKFG